MRYIIIVLILVACTSFAQTTAPGKINIVWVDEFTHGFSFIGNWEYPESVFRNKYGQLSCDGLCPQEIDAMIDKNGKIIKDSMTSFYKIIDTTHQFQSLECITNCYEFAEAKFVDVVTSGDTLLCNTLCNAATHCSLHISIISGVAYAYIQLHSIKPNNNAIFQCSGGSIMIQRGYYNKGTLKASFQLHFYNPQNPKRPLYWKGKIYKRITHQLPK